MDTTMTEVIEVLDEAGVTGAERELLLAEARMCVAVKEGREPDRDAALAAVNALRDMAAEYVSEVTAWPLDLVRVFTRDRGADRAIVLDPEGPYVSDLALPLVLGAVEIAGLQLPEDESNEATRMIEDAIVTHWPNPAMCDGPWGLNLPDGTNIVLTFMERALALHRRGTATT